MEPIAVISILLIMLAVIFASGFATTTYLLPEVDLNERIVISGIFGVMQIFVTFFLVKTFFMLDQAIVVTFLINGTLVAVKWITKTGKKPVE